MKKNIFLGLTIAAILVVGANAVPPSASALTVDEIQTQIKSLLAKIAELQVQMRAATTVQTTPVDPTIAPTPNRHRICAMLNRNLAVGARGDDVQGLQEFLNTEGYLSTTATGYFGPMTANAVARRAGFSRRLCRRLYGSNVARTHQDLVRRGKYRMHERVRAGLRFKTDCLHYDSVQPYPTNLRQPLSDECRRRDVRIRRRVPRCDKKSIRGSAMQKSGLMVSIAGRRANDQAPAAR